MTERHTVYYPSQERKRMVRVEGDMHGHRISFRVPRETLTRIVQRRMKRWREKSRHEGYTQAYSVDVGGFHEAFLSIQEEGKESMLMQRILTSDDVPYHPLTPHKDLFPTRPTVVGGVEPVHVFSKEISRDNFYRLPWEEDVLGLFKIYEAVTGWTRKQGRDVKLTYSTRVIIGSELVAGGEPIYLGEIVRTVTPTGKRPTSDNRRGVVKLH